MAKTPSKIAPSPAPTDAIPQRKRIAMGGIPNAGNGSGPKTKQ